MAALGLAAYVAGAQPTNDFFANATVITGPIGSTNGDNTLATLESCETNILYPSEYTSGDDQTNTTWYQWTCPTNGTFEVDTAGTVFEPILSVWTAGTLSPSGDLCTTLITNITSDDWGQGTYSEVNLPVTAGTTYYICVASWNDGTDPFDNAGAYVLNWSAHYPTVPSGAFSFTTPNYVASTWDSNPPDNPPDQHTVDKSIQGVRITVTRPAPAYGRALVDYTIADGSTGATNFTYQNTFITNYWGTNILTKITSTDTPPVVTYSNAFTTNVLVRNSYGSYAGQIQTAELSFGSTNSTTQIYNVVATNTQTGSSPLVIDATNLPMTTNYQTVASANGSSYATNVFGFLANGGATRGTNVMDGSTFTNSVGAVFTNLASSYATRFTTNFFGTNISIVIGPTGGGFLYLTNIYYTNVAVGLIYTTNSIYTNGTSTITVKYSGTDWVEYASSDVSTWTIQSENDDNYVMSGFPLTPEFPAPTNYPATYGTILLGKSVTYDASSNKVETITNAYSYALQQTQIVPSGNGISLGSGTLVFSNLQMSADIIVPVSSSAGPDAPWVSYIPGYAQITLSNPRLDPQEDTNVLMAPSIASGTATLNLNSPDYGTAGGGAYNLSHGQFVIERSTFRVDKNVPGGNAIVSVYRLGTNGTDAVSVDYVITPARTKAWPFGFDPANGSPECTQDGIVTRQTYVGNLANSFVLQAGSDFATPNVDYTPVTGTLNWGANDFNPKTISIPILNNGLIENNMDLLIQLHDPLPLPPCPPVAPGGMTLGEVNSAVLTILFDDTPTLGGVFPGQQPAGAVDRAWNPDGVADSTPPFQNYPGTTPGAGGTVYALAEQPDGRAIIAGSFVSFDSTPYNRIVRVLPNGYQDPSFQGNSPTLGNNTGANDFIAALALQADGQIVIGGNFTAYNGYNRHHIARLNTDGSLDTSFKPGVGANGTVWAMALQPNGQIIIAGSFTSYNGTAVSQVARLNTDGSLDTNFVVGVIGGTNVVVDALALDASGRILIGGNFDTVAGVNSGAVARLNADGSLDTTFAPGIGTFNPDTFGTDPVNAIAVQADGRILIGGSFAYYNLSSRNGLTRLNPDGTLDLTFQSGVGTLNPITGDADAVDSILLQPDGNILIGGNFVSYNQTRRYGLARVFPDGSLDTSFMDTAYNQFAGIPNLYFNEGVVSPTYPYFNTRNAIYSLALETNAVNTSSNILIGGTFEMVGGGYSRDDLHPRSNVARVIGGATPGPGNIALLYNNYSVNNSDGSLYVSLIRTNGNLGPVGVTFSTTTAAPGPGVATAGQDFFPVTQNPLWVTTYSQEPNNALGWIVNYAEYGPNYAEVPTLNPRNTAADVTLSVFNPGNITGNLSANFSLSQPSGSLQLGGENIPNEVALGAQSTSPLTIIDSNVKAGVIGFNSPVYSVVQGGTATITLTRTNGSQNQVTVWYATVNGTATNGVDYTGSTNQVTFSIGQTSATFTVPTLSKHTSIQPDKTVNLLIFTPSGGATLGVTTAILTVINPTYTPGHLSFSQANYSINENGGSAVITVNRLGGSTGTLGVTFVASGGTATNGLNYIGTTNSLLWNNGDTTSRTIVIPVKDDGVVTPDLTVNLQLANSLVNGTHDSGPLSYGNTASPTNAILTIVNVDSAGSFQFSQATYAVKKYAGYALVPVIRTSGSVGTATVNFTTVDDSAVQGTDYTFVTNTLTFANGEVSKLIVVPIIDNGMTNSPSGPRDLYLQLSDPSGSAMVGTANPAKLYIIDSETVDETPGSPDNTYSTFAGFNGNVYAMTLQANNQLLVGGDFTMADGVTRNRLARLNSDGSLDAGFSLPSDTYGANDSIRAIALQTDGRILVGGFFTNFNGSARGRIARVNADGTLDNLFNPGSGADNPVYAIAQTFVNGDSKVLVGGAFTSIGGQTFNGIGRLNSDGTPDSTFNIAGVGANDTVFTLAVQQDGKVLIGGDFTAYDGFANFNHLARLNADGSPDTNFAVSVTGPNDSVRAIAIQLDGKILIGGLFTNVDGVSMNHIARLNPNGTLDASFVPGLGANDSVFAIATQSDTRIVLGGEFSKWNGVTRNHVTRLNPDGSVDPSINFGTGADDSVDALAIQQDTIAGYPTNLPDEKIIIGGGFTQYDGDSHQHLARIFGGSISGSGAFQFSTANYQVEENGLNALITVTRSGGTTNAPTGDILITATTSAGTAVPGVNYSNIVKTLDFPLGEVMKTFSVPVLDDGVVTPPLTVNLALSNPTSPGQIGVQPTAVLTINNDDSTISFSNLTYSVAKNIVSGVAPINVIRLGGTNTASTVTFMTTSNGTAVAGTDFTPVNQTVTFAPGVNDVAVNIPINNNGLAEGNRTVTMVVTNAIGSTLVNPTNATLTIIDTVTSPGQLLFSATNFMANSDQGIAYLTVLRTNGSSGSVSISYNMTPGTAQPGVNYIASSGTLTFDPGITSQLLPVQLVNSGVIQAPVNLSVALSNPTGGASLIQPTNAMLTIFNTNATINLTQATNTVSEDAGVLNVVVERSNNTNVVSTVKYSTVDGTAVAGVNFAKESGLLTFEAGEEFKSISIPLINQSNTVNLQFSLALTNPVGGFLVPPTNAVVILEGSAAGISFTTNSVTVPKGIGAATFTVICSNPRVEPVVSGSHTVPLEVTYTTVDGSAKAGINYQPTTGTLVFTNGLGTNTFIVPIFNNQLVGSNLTFSVMLTNVTAPGYITPYGTEVAKITESNAGLRFSQPSYSVFKNGIYATIDVYRTGFTDNIVSVDFLATNGTAIGGQNFYPTNGTLIFTNGVTTRSFNVALINNSQVQPNLYALLELSNPTNGVLVSPSVSTLTILETGGSYVQPAGSQMVTNYTTHLADGIIGSNDTVQVLFAFRDAAGLNVTNLVAYLVATNGVLSPNPASQTYGPLTVYGHSVSRPFTFTAHGTNTLTIAPTFQLYDNTKYIGPATFVYTIGSWVTSFANTNRIIIYDGAAASPYPSIIKVAGVGNTLIKATVTLTNLSHQNISDLDALVVSPTTNTLIMGHVGAGNPVAHATLTFDDAATNSLPRNGAVMTGTNKPTQYYPINNFP